jgi:P-type Mg2+ transporter
MTRIARVASGPSNAAAPEHRDWIDVAGAATLDTDLVLQTLGTSRDGLSEDEARNRLTRVGANTVPEHRVTLASIVGGQLRSPLLMLLFATAVLSAVLGQQTNAIIIIVILIASVGLGTGNDYRAARAAKALQADVRDQAMTVRPSGTVAIDVADLVPGDIVRLTIGSIVPADIRLIQADGLSCEESVLTGEALPVEKSIEPSAPGAALAELHSCALMGTVVHAGRGIGVIVATGTRTEFGRIARDLQTAVPQTAFQVGLRQFSVLLVIIAAAVSSSVFAINLLLGRSAIDALLFSAAIAVGITPQLLPAVVATSLADGSRQLARKKVLVKRLVAIEDLGDMEILVTDKTGTLTTGQFRLASSIAADGSESDGPARLAVLAAPTDLGPDGRRSGDPLDVALWAAVSNAAELAADVTVLTTLGFDHERRMTSALVRNADGTQTLVTKGAPEAVLAACAGVTAAQQAVIDTQLGAGGRVIAVASRPAAGLDRLTAADEKGLTLVGLLIFDDPPKPGVSDAIARLGTLDVRVIMATGDSAGAAARLAATVGLTQGPTVEAMSGTDIDQLDDAALGRRLTTASVLARTSPEQKARVVRVLAASGRSVGFLGDGVNDALALHQADVGISVNTAADVARAAADVVLLEKSLDVVADGIAEGRRIFANTIKYVLMGTSSNFGNILSAGAASALLSFLPLLASQLLLNNLLYDTGQLTIPTDHVDESQLARPGHWDLGTIRRFMFCFGSLSSLFDFITFGVLLGPFNADPQLFRSGWFVESLATQAAVVFVIRTRRVPFFRSRPSWPLAVSTVAVIAVGALLPLSPIAHTLGFVAPSAGLYGVIALVVLVYLVVVDLTKTLVFNGFDRFVRAATHPRPSRRRRQTLRRIPRFTPPASPTGTFAARSGRSDPT